MVASMDDRGRKEERKKGGRGVFTGKLIGRRDEGREEGRRWLR